MRGDISNRITDLEAETLRLLAQGLNSTEIANLHHRCSSTIKNRIHLLRAKLGARTSAQAVAIAKDRKIIL